jgi:hypothetical protein
MHLPPLCRVLISSVTQNISSSNGLRTVTENSSVTVRKKCVARTAITKGTIAYQESGNLQKPEVILKK